MRLSDHCADLGRFRQLKGPTRIRSTSVFGHGLNEKCFTNARECQEMSYAG